MRGHQGAHEVALDEPVVRVATAGDRLLALAGVLAGSLFTAWASIIVVATPRWGSMELVDEGLMGAAYGDALGTELCITDSYRSIDGQEQVFKTKPGFAALPGTSNHGWGIAVDLCGGIERFGTPQHDWLSSHGATYGWAHPAWAAATGSKPEPWHFEFTA